MPTFFGPELKKVAPKSGKPGRALKKVGGVMLSFCLSFLIVGRIVVTAFFPEFRAQGLTLISLVILIPIWSVGIVGLLLLLMGWKDP